MLISIPQIRVRSEHFFGSLKGRFQLLCEMRFQIQNQQDLDFVQSQPISTRPLRGRSPGGDKYEHARMRLSHGGFLGLQLHSRRYGGCVEG